MNQFSITYGQASMAVVAQQLRRMGIWEEIERQVRIKQKTVKHTPLEKLLDVFVNILSGGQGVVEINTRVRPDRVLQQLFGRHACADQSSASRTLDRCTAQTVQQMRSALLTLNVRHSQACQHNYQRSYQVLDIDFTGLLAGRQGEGVTKGYFGDYPLQRGRQLGRVLASHYDEILTQRLYPGFQQLAAGLQQLLQETEVILNLGEAQRQRTLIRVDAGGGQDADVNWLLQRGYRVLLKMFSGTRARQLAETVAERDWIIDPTVPGRELAWLEQSMTYDQPTRQVAVRVRRNGHTRYSVLVTNAPPHLLAQLSSFSRFHPHLELVQVVYAYDKRAGGLETHNRGDKQGLGLSKRNKRSLLAQEMLVLLAQLAHNLLVWLTRRLQPHLPAHTHLGMLRLTRDVLKINGRLLFDHHGRLRSLLLNSAHPFANAVFRAFQSEWKTHNLSLILHKF